MKNHFVTEAIGWYGTIAILGAYALNSFGIIQTGSPTYQLLNLTGAIGIVVVSLTKKDYPPATLNIAWGIVALVALIRILVRA